MTNWYAIQVRTGNENHVCEMCRRLIDKEILIESFIPLYERKMKIRGEWIVAKKILFPGYIFMITNNVLCLHESLKKIPAFAKILGVDHCLISLYQSEVDFLKRFYEDEKTLKLSYGYIVGEKVVITEGVLSGLEACIGKIDRHRRTAEIHMDFFGRKTKVVVGLEIVAKYESDGNHR